MASGNLRMVIRVRWSCSNFVQHEHRWQWTARWCGRMQRLWRWFDVYQCMHGHPHATPEARDECHSVRRRESK